MTEKIVTTNINDFFFLKKDNHQLLSIDYGRKKLGIAITNVAHSFALPLKVCLCKKCENTPEAFEEKACAITRYVAMHKIWGIVIGFPINMDGTEGPAALEVKNFAEFLASKLNLPIFLQDERLTSMEADSLLKEAGFSRKERNERDDMISAALIAESLLNQWETLAVTKRNKI
jgi:putative Holliday junction resolvase